MREIITDILLITRRKYYIRAWLKVRGPTSGRVRDRISATIYYRTRLQNLCITGAAAFSAKV